MNIWDPYKNIRYDSLQVTQLLIKALYEQHKLIVIVTKSAHQISFIHHEMLNKLRKYVPNRILEVKRESLKLIGKRGITEIKFVSEQDERKLRGYRMAQRYFIR